MKKSLAEILMYQKPKAYADIRGRREFHRIRGCVYFYPVGEGVLVLVQITGLIDSKNKCKNDIFAFHIHEGDRCTSTREQPFAAVGEHYNPNHCTHPNHSGDLPPLFGNRGFALSCFYTEHFKLEEVIDRTVIIHERPDDFTTQPSGNSGEMIACGAIKKIN